MFPICNTENPGFLMIRIIMLSTLVRHNHALSNIFGCTHFVKCVTLCMSNNAALFLYCNVINQM